MNIERKLRINRREPFKSSNVMIQGVLTNNKHIRLQLIQILFYGV